MDSIELRNKRKQLGYTQKEFAVLVGVSGNTIINWERGDKIPLSKYPILDKVLNNTKPDLLDKIIKSDVKPLNLDEEIEVFTNKNGVKFYLYSDDAIKIEVPIMPFEAYASSQIECYFDENFVNKEFHKTQFNVDKIGKGIYMGFKTKNQSMNGGGINDTPGGAEVLGREIGRQHWLNLHKNDYGFILMTKKAICHKDIINYNKENGMFTLHSRHPSEDDFEISINDVYRIFNVIKRTF